MFKKLDFTLDIDIEKIKTDERIVSYAIKKSNDVADMYSETFVSYKLKDVDYFTELVLLTLKFNIEPGAINYTEVVKEGTPPHVDVLDGNMVVLNYYVQTEDDATLFWEPKIARVEPTPIKQGLNGGPIDDDDTAVGYDDISKLKLVNYFVAKTNDAYLLDTSVIHSVSKRNYNSVRKLIRFFWSNHTFDEVLNSIEILPK